MAQGTVIFDCERMKHANSGLFYFCAQLGQALLEEAADKNDITFFVPGKLKESPNWHINILRHTSLMKIGAEKMRQYATNLSWLSSTKTCLKAYNPFTMFYPDRKKKQLADTKVTLLISTYNWPDALELSLYFLSKQSVMPHEIVIADDGSSKETASVITKMSKLFTIPVKHIWHEDKGFRKSLILNKAIKASEGDYIIQIDGDIIVDPQFIKDHIAIMKRGYFIRGSRTLLKEDTTHELISYYKSGQFDKVHMHGDKNRINSMRSGLLSRVMNLFPGDVLRVKGCNMAYWKKDFEQLQAV